MIAAILSILGSSAFGGILGGIFALLNRKADVASKMLDLEHERAKWGHEIALRSADLEVARAEAAGRKDVAIIEGEATVDAARMAAIAESHAADKVTADEIKAAGKLGWLMVLSSAINKWIRPVATVVLAYAAVHINLLLVHKLTDNWAGLTQIQQYEATMQGLAWITGQAAAALGYWFVARGSSK